MSPLSSRTANQKGVSLLEVISVLAILAVLAALLTPVAAKAKRSAQITASEGLLKQFHLAAKLYQMDYDGDGMYGDLADMGLPNARIYGQLDSMLPQRTTKWASPCGLNPMWSTGVVYFQFVYRPGDGGGEFSEVSRRYQENMVLFFDPNCDEPGTPLANPLFAHRGVGVALSGALLRWRKPGPMYFEDSWWTQPPEP